MVLRCYYNYWHIKTQIHMLCRKYFEKSKTYYLYDIKYYRPECNNWRNNVTGQLSEWHTSLYTVCWSDKEMCAQPVSQYTPNSQEQSDNSAHQPVDR